MTESYTLSVRMPIELGEHINEYSKSEKRSINQTIILLLEYAIREKNRKRKGKKNNS